MLRNDPMPALRRERLATPDGDALTLWHLDGPEGAPRMLVLHGLEGTIRSHYIPALLGVVARGGFRATVMMYRGCDGVLNKAPRLYHSGETSDPDFVARELVRREPDVPLVAAGFSLGGNVLCKWLGECGDNAPVRAGLSVSAPYDLTEAAARIDQVLGGIYARKFLRTLIPKALAKARQYPELLDAGAIRRARTLVGFDHVATAPMHGFKGADDYYEKASSLPFLASIRVPTVLVGAYDDPLVPKATLPFREVARSRWLRAVWTERGGHLGWVQGWVPMRPTYWWEGVVAAWLEGALGGGDPATGRNAVRR